MIPVVVEDVNKVEEANKEVIKELLLEQPLIREGKRTRTNTKSYNVVPKYVCEYQYGHTHLQTDPRMRSIPKCEYDNIHLQTVGIINDMYATAANSERGNPFPMMTNEDRDVYIMGVILT